MISVICNLIARLSPLQKSDTKKEKGKGSEDLRLVTSGMHKVYGQCTCDKMADLMYRGKL